MSYDPNISRIQEMINVVDQAKAQLQNDVDLVNKAEVEVERLRQLNYRSPISPVGDAATNLIGGYTPKKLVGVALGKGSDIGGVEARSRALNQALISLASSVFSRAVGPVEELSFRQLQDGVRRKIILTRTQLGAEQKLIAKYMQGRYNKWIPDGNTKDTKYGKNFSVSYTVGGDGTYTPTIPEDGKPIGKSVEGSNIPVIPYKDLDLTNFNMWGKDFNEQYTRHTGISNPRFGYRDENFPFYIHNLANGLTETFPAFIKTLNESVTSTWNTQGFINRSEEIYIYQRGDRSFDMAMMMFATSNSETISVSIGDVQKRVGYPMYPILPEGKEVASIDFITKEDLWRKINFLHQCTRPSYVDNVYSKAPYCLLTIGHLFQDITAVIDSINLNYEPLIWDLNRDIKEDSIFGGIKPMIVEITISGKLLHRSPPSANYQFYLGGKKYE